MEKGKADSLYMRLWQRNHCNHRDYQNLAKNGADSFSMNSQLVKSLSRDQNFDQPALVFYSAVGNDVCNHWPNYDHMTTPEQMHVNVLKTLTTLDNQLPKGSHVFLVGLVDGRVLFDAMHDRIHPLGQLRGDVTYAKFYDFMNCLQVSPCFGWMNSNGTVRNFTFNRASELNEVLMNIAKTETYENFDVHFFECPFQQVIQVTVCMFGSCVICVFECSRFDFKPIMLNMGSSTCSQVYQTHSTAENHLPSEIL